MWSLPRPTITSRASVEACSTGARDPKLTERYVAGIPAIEAATRLFEASAIAGTLHTLNRGSFTVPGVSQKEMEALYNDGMIRRAKGRLIYENLLAAHPQRRCTFCGQRTVSTLDHHLPKTAFAALTVVPINLIPACKDCNTAKLAAVPTTAGEVPIHPYYDRLEADLWLRADVVQGPPSALVFFVDAPAKWGQTLAARVKHHFFEFELDFLYGVHAAAELENIRLSLTNHYGAGGTPGIARVTQHLQREAASRQAVHVNSWQTAMYTALAADSWFCDGGFQA